MHTAQLLSVVEVPLSTRPDPTWHVLHHGVHTSLPAVILNVPWGQVRHVRSVLAVCTLSRYIPAEHGALIAWQAAPSLALEKVAPVHAAHWRLAVVEPGADVPEPAAQVRHSAQTPLPADALNVPLMHVAQVRSLETVEALSM